MYTCDFVLIMIIFSQDSKTAKLVWREISGVMKEERESADGSLLMVEEGGEGDEAHGDQMELSTT